MQINQEEGGLIEDYFYDKLKEGLKSVEVVATDTYCDTDVLKALCEVVSDRLNEFVKFIEKTESENEKTAKDKVLEILNKHKVDM